MQQSVNGVVCLSSSAGHSSFCLWAAAQLVANSISHPANIALHNDAGLLATLKGSLSAEALHISSASNDAGSMTQVQAIYVSGSMK